MGRTKGSKNQNQNPDAELRSCAWVAVLYPDDLPADWREQLVATKIRICISPLHDQDRNADGSPKKQHYHVMTDWDKNKKSMKQVKEFYKNLYGSVMITDADGNQHESIPGVALSPTESPVHSKVGYTRYFAHMDNPDKYQYDPMDIIGYNGYDVGKNLVKNSSERNECIKAIEDYINDTRIVDYDLLTNHIRRNDAMLHEFLTTDAIARYHLRDCLTAKRSRSEAQKKLYVKDDNEAVVYIPIEMSNFDKIHIEIDGEIHTYVSDGLHLVPDNDGNN